ncbi:hypothetical protein A2870_03455 [Candidatus Curtissbacteria bacterium RIFCSPHIGHO2_01_FULL_41_11]|uniref:Uncharacterized protein n=1 Tax=Candidatus Curtissbacteria bacterium RIFCSPHIGHO2_01_FULL_41_11 TaxID=1797711 RepID=A0A1F5G5R8_9BACT|nr:MAG: hypothetical protein A2870_03455 [Candidatus Curtissbacteria bacterium RIFCSPHIGHO2_01_FULL_41_11]
MFVILGIIILVVSFVIALASLIREQQKNEKILNTEDDSNSQTQEGVETTQEDLVRQGDDADKRREEAARKLEAIVENQKAAAAREDATTDQPAVGLKPTPFFWEEPSGDDLYNKGDETEEVKLEESRPQESFGDVTETSVEDTRTLAGVIELRKQAKAKKSS